MATYNLPRPAPRRPRKPRKSAVPSFARNGLKKGALQASANARVAAALRRAALQRQAAGLPPPSLTGGSTGAAGSPGSGPGSPAPAPGVIDPYAFERKYGMAGALDQLDRDQAAHQAYVTDKVTPWLSGGLAALTGVNPSAPGYNPLIQQQYLANIAGQVGGSLDVAASATPMTPASVTPGGIMAAPNAYQGAAMREYSAQRGGAAILSAQAQSALNTLGPNTFAQAAVMQMADYAKGLPDAYVQKRSDLRTKIDDYIQSAQIDAAKQAEVLRHNKVTEAISAQNAQTNAAIQFGRLGIDTTKAAQAGQQQPKPKNLPVGTIAVPNSSGGWSVRNDPTYVKPGSGGGSGGSSAPSASKGQYPRNVLAKQGFVGGWKVKPATKPPGAKGTYVRALDGSWWIKPGSSSTPAGAKPKPGTDAQTIYQRLGDAVLNGTISDQQSVGTPDLLRFLKPMQPSKKGAAWNSWYLETLATLKRVDPKYAQWIEGWRKRRVADGTFKGTF